MKDYIETARSTLLEPAEVGENDLSTVLGRLSGQQIDHADLYLQYSRSESWSLEEGIVKSGAFGISKGAGLRAVSGEKTGFAFSDDLSLPALKHAAASARGIAHGVGSRDHRLISKSPLDSSTTLYGNDDPLNSLGDIDKVALLEQVEQEARKQDTRIKEVFANIAGEYEIVMVFRQDGTLSADIRPLVRLNVTAFSEQDGRRERGSFGGGMRGTYDCFIQDGKALEYAREAARQALVNLEAVDAPAGTMTVVLGPGWPGILLHEAVGHGLEGDHIRKGSSVFCNRVGERVASDLCTIVDDGTIAGRRGSLNVDDEGTPTEKTILIENGILKTYMQDITNARLMGQKSTGNGRRESYKHLPMPRMTNTYMLSGNSDHDEIIRSVRKGLYAVQFGGGQVDITSGKFVFSATEAYLIENGKITQPVKGATLIGSGPDVLTKVSMVGDNIQLDSGVGTCGKNGQSVPVGVGQPTLKVDELTVGGVLV